MPCSVSPRFEGGKTSYTVAAARKRVRREGGIVVLPDDIQQMEQDFLSGRNPLAYIPVCISLRKKKQYRKALDLCKRGLSLQPDSLAGRTLLSRLLCDLGHYEEALREVGRMEAGAPDAMGLKIEKTRALVKLQRLEEAEKALQELSNKNPLDPQVQMLAMQFRRLASRSAENRNSSVSGETAPIFLRLTNQELLERLLEDMKGLVKINSMAVIPIGVGEVALEGSPEPAEAAYSFWKGTSQYCEELDCGSLSVGLIETEQAQLIVLVRKNTIVSLSIVPTVNFGKIFHRFQMVVGQLLAENMKSPSHEFRSET